MKHNPMDTLIELAQNQTDEARRRLGELQRAQLSASEQLTLLEKYRAEYLVRLDHAMAQGLSMEQLRNDQGFIETLDQAIAQQTALAQDALQRLDQGREAWQQSARKLGAFDTLAERIQRHALLVRSRREQRDTDERAARAGRTNPLTSARGWE